MYIRCWEHKINWKHAQSFFCAFDVILNSICFFLEKILDFFLLSFLYANRANAKLKNKRRKIGKKLYMPSIAGNQIYSYSWGSVIAWKIFIYFMCVYASCFISRVWTFNAKFIICMFAYKLFKTLNRFVRIFLKLKIFKNLYPYL